MVAFWKPGDVLVGRGIFNNRVWTAIPVIAVKDTPKELGQRSCREPNA